MQGKIIAAAAGGFGAGALVTWAVVQDYRDRTRLAELEWIWKVVSDKQDRLEKLENYVRLSLTIRQVVEGADEDPNQQSFDEFEQVSLDEGSEVQMGIELTDAEPVETVETVEEDDYVVPEGETEPITRGKLQELIDQYAANPEDSSEIVQRVVDGYESPAPYVISTGEYADKNEYEHFDSITLTYYYRHQVLLSEEEETEDIPRTVGSKNLNRFGDMSNDPEVVYIRNPRLETDFEVVKTDDDLPIHVKYGLGKEEYRVNKAAGTLRFPDDE